MTKRAFPASHKTCLAGALAGLLLAAVLPLSAIAAERVVLCEEFTSLG
jgi:hypothetical protein